MPDTTRCPPPRRPAWVLGCAVSGGAECTLRVLLLLALAGATAGKTGGPQEVPIYFLNGSSALLLGMDEGLKGSDVLEWTVEKNGSAEPDWILSYHYDSTEAEVNRSYEHRVSLSFTNGSLTLANATSQDSGRYTLHQKMEKKTRVRVLHVLKPVSGLEMWLVQSAECSVLLRCKASGDVMNMTWTINGREVPQNHTLGENVIELTIRLDSHDTYTCVAWNPASEQRKTHNLEDPVGLPFIGFLVAAVVLMIPTLLGWSTFLLRRSRCRPDVKVAVAVERSICVSWLLFFFCTLTSASIAQYASIAQSASMAQSASIVYPSPVPFGIPEFNLVYLLILTGCLVLDLLLILADRLKISLKRCSGSQGAVQIVQIGLRLFALGFFIATLIYYFSTYYTACRRPHGFALTISLSVVASVVVIPLLYCAFRYSCLNGVLGDRAAASSLNEKEQHESVEMKIPVNTSTYAEVATEEGFVGS